MSHQRTRTHPRQTILDAIASYGYEALEVSWVQNPLGDGGAWAATFRRPGTWDYYHVHAIYLGKLLDRIFAYPNLLLEEDDPAAGS